MDTLRVSLDMREGLTWGALRRFVALGEHVPDEAAVERTEDPERGHPGALAIHVGLPTERATT